MAIQVLELRPDLVYPARRVPGVAAQGDRPERLLRTRATDEDRQLRLERPRLADRVVERVEAALVAESLAVEQPAQHHDRLVEPVEALAEPGPEVDPERLV